MCLRSSGLAKLRKEFSVSPGSKYESLPEGWARFAWISAGWGPAAAALCSSWCARDPCPSPPRSCRRELLQPRAQRALSCCSNNHILWLCVFIAVFSQAWTCCQETEKWCQIVHLCRKLQKEPLLSLGYFLIKRVLWNQSCRILP